MSDTIQATEVVVLTTDVARVNLIESLREVRSTALALETKEAAVEHAIQNTVQAAEQAITSTGAEVPVLQNLSEQLVASWAETVNS